MKKVIPAVTAVLFLFTLTLPKTTAQQNSRERILHFPKDYSLGQVSILDETAVRKIKDFHFWVDGINDKWEYLCSAMGDVTIPAGKRVQLILSSSAWQNPRKLTELKTLGPNDIHTLFMSPSYAQPGSPKPNDKCMPYIAHLTGLKVLNLEDANITNKGLQYLTEMKSLQILYPPRLSSDAGMAQIAKIKSLKALYFRDNYISDDGLKYLAELENLEELALDGKRMTDDGLKHLANLPKLRYLLLQSKFTDDGMRYLKDIPNLKTLNVFSSEKLTDEGLKSISEIKQLETLGVHWMDQITDEGIAHLIKIPNLKKLDIGHAKLTDKGCEIFKQVKTLEYLHLPNFGLTNEGLAHICELENLTYLWASGSSNSPLTDKTLENISKLKKLEELCIGGTRFTDNGLKNITILKNLTQFWLFCAPEVTNKGLVEIGKLTNLENLSLPDETKITTGGLKNLNTLTSLEILDIHSARQDNSIMDISRLTNLKDLAIVLHRTRTEKDKFTDKDLACLANLKKLQCLQLCSPGIGDEGLKHLSGLTNLDFLNISDSEITDDGLKYCSNMNRLWRLMITGGHFTEKAFNHLVHLKNIRWLELKTDKSISRADIAKLRRMMPQLEKLDIQTQNSQ